MSIMCTFKMETFLLCLCIFSFYNLKMAQSDCFLNYPEDIETVPIYMKQFGKYSTVIPYNGHILELVNGEMIQAVCPTSFNPVGFQHYYGSTPQPSQSSIYINCQGNNLYTGNFQIHNVELQCNKLNWTIYETNNSHKWCERDADSGLFLLATEAFKTHYVLASICYDFTKWSLEAITYNLTASNVLNDVELLRDIRKTELFAANKVGNNLWNFKVTSISLLTTMELERQVEEMRKTNSWLHLCNYELSSIVQGKSYSPYFNQYPNTLNVIWWHNLRVGNWKRFMDTLETYAYNNSFQLYTGTSGMVEVPTTDLRSSNNVLQFKDGFRNVTVPAYIWSYLISNDDLNDDFIIVGYNSPFFEFFDSNALCPDICNTIPWLKDIRSTFSFATAGVIFCCDPQYIQQNNYLNGFPMEVLNLRLNVTLTYESIQQPTEA